jgi:hypothetical protein
MEEEKSVVILHKKLLQHTLLIIPLNFQMRFQNKNCKITDCGLQGLLTLYISLIFICGETKKNEVYLNNPHTLDELKHGVCETTISVEVSDLMLVSNNIFMRTEVCIRAERGNSEHLL